MQTVIVIDATLIVNLRFKLVEPRAPLYDVASPTQQGILELKSLSRVSGQGMPLVRFIQFFMNGICGIASDSMEAVVPWLSVGPDVAEREADYLDASEMEMAWPSPRHSIHR